MGTSACRVRGSHGAAKLGTGRAISRLQRPGPISRAPLVGARTPRWFDEARFEGFGRNDGHGHVSPDGRWLAYGQTSRGSGNFMCKVSNARSRQGQISTLGGISPVWRRDGRELFYYPGRASLWLFQSLQKRSLTIGSGVPCSQPTARGLSRPFRADAIRRHQRRPAFAEPAAQTLRPRPRHRGGELMAALTQ